jgi:prepilin-type N-terminal cleavage/methylation domain-containing protein
MTLIEIMIVVAIISLVLSAVGMVSYRAYARAQLRNTWLATVKLQQSVEMYRVERGRCPADVDTLLATGTIPRRPLDAWGSDYLIRCEQGEQAVATSKGPDRELDTDDDIASNGPDPAAD